MVRKFSKYDAYVNFKTKKRADITTLFENQKAFSSVVEDMTKHFKDKKIDKVACLDALGFILGSPISIKLKKPLVLIRKRGKLPYPPKDLLRMEAIGVKESTRRLEMRRDAIKKGDKVLLVDEWIHTGTQVLAAIKMIEKLGGVIIGISCFSINDTTKQLFESYEVKQVRVHKKKS